CWVSSLGSSSCFSNETFLSSPRFLPHTISRTIATIRTTTAMPIHNVKFDTMRSILTASGLHCVRWVHPLGNNSRHTVATHRNSRSEEHTSELQSRFDIVCRLLLEKKKKKKI